MTKKMHSRDALHKSKAALWLVIEVKMCISVIR